MEPLRDFSAFVLLSALALLLGGCATPTEMPLPHGGEVTVQTLPLPKVEVKHNSPPAPEPFNPLETQSQRDHVLLCRSRNDVKTAEYCFCLESGGLRDTILFDEHCVPPEQPAAVHTSPDAGALTGAAAGCPEQEECPTCETCEQCENCRPWKDDVARMHNTLNDWCDAFADLLRDKDNGLHHAATDEMRSAIIAARNKRLAGGCP